MNHDTAFIARRKSRSSLIICGREVLNLFSFFSSFLLASIVFYCNLNTFRLWNV